MQHKHRKHAFSKNNVILSAISDHNFQYFDSTSHDEWRVLLSKSMFVKKGRVFCSYMDSRGQSASFRYSAEHIFVSGRFQNHHGVKTAQLGKKKLEKSKVFIIKTGKAVKKVKNKFCCWNARKDNWQRDKQPCCFKSRLGAKKKIIISGLIE